MMKLLDKNVLVKENQDNTVTIMKESYPNLNSRRVPRQAEIVVSYFTEDDLKRLRNVQITPKKVKSSALETVWERYVAYLMNKEE